MTAPERIWAWEEKHHGIGQGAGGWISSHTHGRIEYTRSDLIPAMLAAAEARGAAREREACATVADRLRENWLCANGFEGFATGAKNIAAAIRARSE